MTRDEELALIEKFVNERGVNRWAFEPTPGTEPPSGNWRQRKLNFKKARGQPRKKIAANHPDSA